MKNRDLICIVCPIGCHLEVSQENSGELQVRGNQCPRGIEYAMEEVNSPKRIVTTTVALTPGSLSQSRMPVRTDKPLPMEHIPAILAQLHSITLSPPINRGDLLIENYKGTEVNVIASLSTNEVIP